MPALITAIAYEDIATGKRKPVTAEGINLADVGSKPTVRADAAPGVSAVKWTLTSGGKPVKGYSDWLDKNAPFRLVPGDKPLTLPPGVYTVTVTPCDANGKVLGATITATLSIGKASDADPLPQTPGDQSGPAPLPAIGLGDLAKKPYSAMKDRIAALKLTSLRVWVSSRDFGTYKRDDEFDSALGYARAGLDVYWCLAQDGVTPDMAKKAPAYTLALLADLIAAYDADPATKGKTVYLIFGNEPDLELDGRKKYWGGTIDHYVATFTAVAVAVKAKYGTRVAIGSAGFSWNIAELERVAPTLAKIADFLCFHGYPKEIADGAENMTRMDRFIDLCAKCKLPGVVDEASPGFGRAVKAGTKTMADWVAAWPKYLQWLGRKAQASGVKLTAILFNAYNIGTTNSAGAMLTDAGEPTESFKAVADAVSA